MFKLTKEQLQEYVKNMEETIKKVMKEDHIIHGYMLYECTNCGKVYIMNLERGLEDPTYDAETGKHKPVPFSFICPCCGGNAFHVSWDLTKSTLGKNYRSYREMTDEKNVIIFRNFFWNDPNSECGGPVIFGPDAYEYSYESIDEKEKRHVINVKMSEKECTLQNLIDLILSIHKDKYGYIYIIEKEGIPWYGYPKFEYRHGEIIKEPGYLSNKVYNYKVKSVVNHAFGHLVDWEVILKKED